MLLTPLGLAVLMIAFGFTAAVFGMLALIVARHWLARWCMH